MSSGTLSYPPFLEQLSSATQQKQATVVVCIPQEQTVESLEEPTANFLHGEISPAQNFHSAHVLDGFIDIPLCLYYFKF